MLINDFNIRCSKFNYSDLKLAGRPIELHINDVDIEEVIKEIERHKIKLYNSSYVNMLERENVRLESEIHELRFGK